VDLAPLLALVVEGMFSCALSRKTLYVYGSSLVAHALRERGQQSA